MLSRRSGTRSPPGRSPLRLPFILKNMFGEQQMTALADYILAALMLKYNERTVG